MKSAYLALVFGAVALFAVCAADFQVYAGTEKPTPSPWFECPGDGSFVNPYDCHKYFVCISETAWAFVCPAHLYFNQAKHICDTKANANCTPIVTNRPNF